MIYLKLAIYLIITGTYLISLVGTKRMINFTEYDVVNFYNLLFVLSMTILSILEWFLAASWAHLSCLLCHCHLSLLPESVELVNYIPNL